MIKLYKEKGVNPLGGCLPILIQMPLLIALFQVFRKTIEFRGAPFLPFWITDLAQPDVILQFDFLKNIGFKGNNIGLHGISLGASTSIFAAYNEPEILATWADSSLAEFNMILDDEIARYGLSIEFGPAVSLAGKILTGLDPTLLSPALKLSKTQSYFFTHGDSDKRVLTRHFDYFRDFVLANNINAEFWLADDSDHLDGMLKYTNKYADKMESFFNSNLK